MRKNGKYFGEMESTGGGRRPTGGTAGGRQKTAKTIKTYYNKVFKIYNY